MDDNVTISMKTLFSVFEENHKFIRFDDTYIGGFSMSNCDISWKIFYVCS